MIPSDVSCRLRALRFPMIVGVVFIHAYYTQVSLKAGHIAGTNEGSFAAIFTRNLISQGLGRLAVPFFFLISGFLFFQGYEGLADYRQKLRRRSRTLLLPFLIWNAATLVVFALGESLPATQVFFANKYWPPVRDFHLLDYVNAFSGLAGKYPICYQMWFLRDLMALQVVTPLLFVVLKRKNLGNVLLVLTALLWFYDRWPVVWPANEAVAFFTAGSWLAVRGVDVTASDAWHRSLSVLFMFLLVLGAVPEPWATPFAHKMIIKVMILCGLPVVWWATKRALENLEVRHWLFRLSASSFFVYAAHEPLLTMSRKFIYRLMPPHSGVTEIGWYFAIPVVLITVLVATGERLSLLFPSAMKVLTGGEEKNLESLKTRPAALV